MSRTATLDHVSIIRRDLRFHLVVALGALCVFSFSCIKPMSPEDAAKQKGGGYTIVGRLQTTGYAQGIAVADSFAYIAQGQCGVAIANVGDPQKPQLLSELLYEIPGYAHKVAYVKDSAGAEVLFSADGAGGVASMDVADKRHPTVTRPSAGFKPSMDIFVCKRFLFCADSLMGVGIGDISDPKFPQPVANIQVSGFCKGVCISSDGMYMLLASGEDGFVMENISQLAAGSEIPDTLSGRLDLPGVAEGITIKPGTKYAFLACGPAGLQIIDYTDTANIKLVGSFATGGYAKAVCVADDRAYVATGKQGVQIIDVSSIASPRRIGTVATSDARGITASNGYVYAADQYEGLIIIKIP